LTQCTQRQLDPRGVEFALVLAREAIREGVVIVGHALSSPVLRCQADILPPPLLGDVF